MWPSSSSSVVPRPAGPLPFITDTHKQATTIQYTPFSHTNQHNIHTQTYTHAHKQATTICIPFSHTEQHNICAQTTNSIPSYHTYTKILEARTQKHTTYICAKPYHFGIVAFRIVALAAGCLKTTSQCWPPGLCNADHSCADLTTGCFKTTSQCWHHMLTTPVQTTAMQIIAT